MNRLLCLALAATIAVGCGKKPRYDDDAPSTPARVPAPEPVKDAEPKRKREPLKIEAPENAPGLAEAPMPRPIDEKTIAFRAGMAKFIKESRSLVRAMDLLPTRAVYKKRIELVQELYSRIPDPPAGDAGLEACQRRAKAIAGVGFESGLEYLELAEGAARLKEKGLAQEGLRGFFGTGGRVKAALDELEAAVAEGRAPKTPEK